MAGDERPQRSPDAHSVTSTSRSLLARVRRNEPQAWERLVALYTPLVYYWCRKLDVPHQDDVVQEVFNAVAGNMQRFRKERPQDTFRGWLRTIARSKVMDYYRRGGREPKAAGGTAAQRRLAEVPADESIDDEEERQAHSELYQRALELIRSDFQQHTWQAFWRVVVDGQAPKDVAEELGMKPGTVRVAKCRVLQRLRQELGELVE
jgi:RNA polymerase sigma-70 factor (ECF subfamily)